MRVLLLSQFFDPEPTLKGLAYAKALRALGHDVQVLTGFPNYPGGEVAKGYRLVPYMRETMDGIVVHRVALYPSHDRSALRRVANYVSFALMACLVGPFVTGRLDAMIVHHPPLTIDWSARLLRLLKRAPYSYEVHDLWPDTLGSTGMMCNSRLLAMIGRWARKAYRSADHVVATSHGFRRRLMEEGVPEERITVLHNWAEEGRFQASPLPSGGEGQGVRGKGRAELNLCADRFNVMFAGNMGLAQALDPVLDAAKRLPDVQFAMVGGGVERDRLVARAEAEGIANVVFVPRQPMERMGAILPLADALLIHLRDDPLFAITIPGKTQTYLAAGVPVVCAVRGDAADLVLASGGGVVAEPENPDALVEAVRRLQALTPGERAAMGALGRAYYERELSMAAGVPVVDGILRGIAKRGMGILPMRATGFQPVDSGAPPCPAQSAFYARYGKRLFDVAASLVLIALMSPAMLVLALLVHAKLGSPVIFRQRRPGQKGKAFAMTKFRSMHDGDGPDCERLTPFGAKLRATSLDELPELFNVLKGEMSLVGPRPLLERYTPWYTPEERRRMDVRPGITGLAQIQGRNELPWNDRLAYDVRYVETMSFWGDLRILARTVGKVLRRDGVQIVPGRTMLDLDAERRAHA